jgi:hypothetical protein
MEVSSDEVLAQHLPGGTKGNHINLMIVGVLAEI